KIHNSPYACRQSDEMENFERSEIGTKWKYIFIPLETMIRGKPLQIGRIIKLTLDFRCDITTIEGTQAIQARPPRGDRLQLPVNATEFMIFEPYLNPSVNHRN